MKRNNGDLAWRSGGPPVLGPLCVLLVYSSVLRTMLLVVVDMLRRITVYRV